MSQEITLRVRPGDPVRFPNRCVACGQPATERHTLQAKRGQVTRRLDAPLCAACARNLARRSGREEQLLRTGRLAAAVSGVVLFALAALLVGGNLWLRGLAGLVAGGAAAGLVWWLFRRQAAAARLPETRAVHEAARIVGFSWREMSLAFANEAVAAAVAELNETAGQPLKKATAESTDSDALESV